MAGKSTTSKKTDSDTTGAGKVKVEWKGYVNYDMTKDQGKAAKEFLLKNPEFTQQALQEVVEDGYSLKVNWSEHVKGVSAGLYCQNAELPNAGYCLTQHSANVGIAIEKVLYVHFRLLGKSWDANGSPRDLDAGW